MPALDARKTAPLHFGREGPECLLLHGFTGSPWDLEPLAHALAGDGFSVSAPLLPGHGGDPEEMAQATSEDWLRAAEEALQQAVSRQKGPVRLAGFSMGALLALIVAARRSEQVQALALLAPAVRLQGMGPRAVRALRRLPWVDWLMPYQTKSAPDLEDDGARTQAPRLSRFPTARLRELFLLQDLADALAPAVRAPSLLVLAAEDHVVDARAARRLYGRVPGAGGVEVLSRGFHGLARDRDGTRLARAVATFFSQHV